MQNSIETITDSDYIHQRREPKPGDPLYLVLSDLLMALRKYKTSNPLEILDYGCGGSPYQNLFPNANYFRADLSEAKDLDYALDTESRCSAEDNHFDLILSTQVLEHVKNPSFYLEECYRMLKPGGRLILSTHGTFEDHACPYDYYRWTSDGLALTIEQAGLEIQGTWKITAGPRAALFLLERYLLFISASRYTLFGLAIWLMRKVKKSVLHETIDRLFEKYRVCHPNEKRSSLYICLLAEAVKPISQTNIRANLES